MVQNKGIRVRINLVNPKELYDQHLIAEYNEIRLMCMALKRTLRSKNGFVLNKVPKRYTLNKGHAYFFFNKGKYLHKRFDALKKEMRFRGFNANCDFIKNVWPKSLYKDWKHQRGDLKIIRERINEKISMKPDWYRKTIRIST